MKREVAREVMELLTSAGRQVSQALDVARAELDDKRRPEYVKATGEVLGWIEYYLLRPVLEEHPDLKPKD